jgi:hypothetical protein
MAGVEVFARHLPGSDVLWHRCHVNSFHERARFHDLRLCRVADLGNILIVVCGQSTFSLPLPHNAPAGEYSLALRELASGLEAKTQWKVK